MCLSQTLLVMALAATAIVVVPLLIWSLRVRSKLRRFEEENCIGLGDSDDCNNGDERNDEDGVSAVREK